MAGGFRATKKNLDTPLRTAHSKHAGYPSEFHVGDSTIALHFEDSKVPDVNKKRRLRWLMSTTISLKNRLKPKAAIESDSLYQLWGSFVNIFHYSENSG